MGKIILGYWDIRGLAEPIRMMLEFGDLEYDDKRYLCGQDPPYDKSCWLSVKETLGLSFPNLPYLIDGDMKLTESMAIAKYVARKAGLMPTVPAKVSEAEMLEGVVNTLREHFTMTCYYDAIDLATIKERQPPRLGALDKHIGENKTFLLGDNLSYVDFWLYETLDHHRLLYSDILDNYSNLKRFMKSFESQERIAAYFKSDRYKKFPINNPMAKWGGKKQ